MPHQLKELRMSEQKTPKTDAFRISCDGCQHWDANASDWVHDDEIEELFKSHRQLETALADARAALREHVESHEADFPPFDMGQRAQDEWAQRRADATRNARNVLAKQG